MTFPHISLLEVPIIKQIISFYVWIFQIYLICMPHPLNLFSHTKRVMKSWHAPVPIKTVFWALVQTLDSLSKLDVVTGSLNQLPLCGRERVAGNMIHEVCTSLDRTLEVEEDVHWLPRLPGKKEAEVGQDTWAPRAEISKESEVLGRSSGWGKEGCLGSGTAWVGGRGSNQHHLRPVKQKWPCEDKSWNLEEFLKASIGIASRISREAAVTVNGTESWLTLCNSTSLYFSFLIKKKKCN